MGKRASLHLCTVLFVVAALSGLSFHAIQTASASNAGVPEVSQEALNLSEKQRNSINMLNYLTVLMQEINDSSNSRLCLEEVYSSLINNIDPNSIDESTLAHLNEILETLDNHRMLDAKRSRLEYKHEQDQARAVHDALTGVTSSGELDTTQLTATVLGMVVDGALGTSGVSLSEEEVEYLQHRLELDDEEATIIHDSRMNTFTYTVQTVNAYGLPSSLVLTENAVAELVSWKNNDNIASRIRFLESNATTYQALGAYWLLLAESYYYNGDYQQCLDAVQAYEVLGVGIFRKDYEYARVLTMAIAAGAQVLSDEEFVELSKVYTARILDNCDNSDWDMRYFAAQSYVELYNKTNDPSYLELAYETTFDNVNYLVPKQIELNASYLSPIIEIPVPDGATKDEKKEIEDYNKLLKAERKTALAPVYEPLLLNCSLLVSIVNQLDIGEEARCEIDEILHGGGACLFLIESLDNQFWFSSPSADIQAASSITYSGKELRIPIRDITEHTTISVTIHSDDSEATFRDWVITKVERETEGDVKTYIAVYSSDQAKKFDYKEGMLVQVQIDAYDGLDLEPITISYRAVNTKDAWWETAMVWDSGIDFVEEAPAE